MVEVERVVVSVEGEEDERAMEEELVESHVATERGGVDVDAAAMPAPSTESKGGSDGALILMTWGLSSVRGVMRKATTRISWK